MLTALFWLNNYYLDLCKLQNVVILDLIENKKSVKVDFQKLTSKVTFLIKFNSVLDKAETKWPDLIWFEMPKLTPVNFLGWTPRSVPGIHIAVYTYHLSDWCNHSVMMCIYCDCKWQQFSEHCSNWAVLRKMFIVAWWRRDSLGCGWGWDGPVTG